MVKQTGNIEYPGNPAKDYIIVLLCGAALYLMTCAPGAVWQDSGLIQYKVLQNDIEGKLGLALSHPLFHIIAIAAKYVPIGEATYKVNIVTALISAVAVANLFLLLCLLLKQRLPAVVGALSLALSHTFWRHATIPETYNLTAALLLAELILLLQYARTSRVRYIYLLSLVNGLAIANHMLASIAFVCYLVLLIVLTARKQVKTVHLAAAAVLWIVGALPYEILIAGELVSTGDFWGTMASAAFGKGWHNAVLNTSVTGRIVEENLMLLILNFPTPNLLLLFVGVPFALKCSPKRWFGIVLTALLMLFLLFAFRYTVPDRYAFFIPFYCLVSLFIGAGASRLLRMTESKAAGYAVLMLCLLTMGAYVAAPKVAKRLDLFGTKRRQIPYRDDYVYFLQPWRTGYRGAERFATEVLQSVEPDAIIRADSTTVAPLLCVQLSHPEWMTVKVVSGDYNTDGSPEFNENTIGQLLSDRDIYVVSPVKGYCPDFLLEGFSFTPAGLIWRVVPKTVP